MSTDDMQKCGESYISELGHHYGIDDCTAQQEWVNFRLVMKNNVNPVIYAAKKIMRFCRFLTKILFLLNNIYANQIPGQSTCVKSFIFVSSYLCALTTTRIIRINNITA